MMKYYKPRNFDQFQQWCSDFADVSDEEFVRLRTHAELEITKRKKLNDNDEYEEDIEELLDMNTDEIFFYAWMR